MLSRRRFCVLLAGATHLLHGSQPCSSTTLSVEGGGEAKAATAYNSAHFPTPPDSARPYVLWMWMGHNISAAGITRDLEAMREAGIGGATIFSLADTVTPWAGAILKSPTPEIVSFTERWWALVRHAAGECHRLGLELSLHNCAGYESSGGTWITPELSMQEVVWSEHRLAGGTRFRGTLERAKVDPHPHARFPDCYIPSEGKIGVPIVEGRRSYYRDIAVLAVPSEGVAAKDRILDLSSRMSADGSIDWDAPAGEWTIYRFGHTTTGAMIQPAQWDAMGLECDKMSKEAVIFHVQHVLDEMKKHLGDQMGKGLTTLYFDSYEAGDPTWTPKMREEFQSRRGYELTPWLPVLADRVVGSDAETKTFKKDFKRTVEDLYRDCYWATPRPLAHQAGVKFNAEPYDGPWQIGEVVQYLDTPTVEFWTTDNRYSPQSLDPVVKAARRLGDRLVAAEAFTTQPKFGMWTEHPAWLKPIGDAAFCAGVNRVNVHHFVQQPWDAKYQPGNVMGQWGIHLGRYQTWWKPGRAWLAYLHRCQYLLQCGQYVAPSDGTSLKVASDEHGPEIQSIHRRDDATEIYFIANTAWTGGRVDCTFPVHGLQPELWDPVANTTRDLQQFHQTNSTTSLALEFGPTQSFFVVFRRPVVSRTKAATAWKPVTDFPALQPMADLEGAWRVGFDPRWGGPKTIQFDALIDWTAHPDAGIRFYSGTAVYSKTLELVAMTAGRRVYLDLGEVNHIAEVMLNGKNLGVVWTAPWRVDITDAVKPGKNALEIAVTNVWANRLIGDEQYPPDIIWQIGDPRIKSGYFLKEFPDWFLRDEPRPVKERLTFTTWNYFTKDSPLESSGLMGPVLVLAET
jgi:alpha-L-rhamnosidase